MDAGNFSSGNSWLLAAGTFLLLRVAGRLESLEKKVEEEATSNRKLEKRIKVLEGTSS